MDIKIGCHAVIQKDGECLLGIRNKVSSESHKQLYTVGGTLELGETLEQCLRREVKEETNIDIQNIQFFKYYERIHSEDKMKIQHSLVFAFTADYASGSVCGGEDCVDPQFYSLKEIQQFSCDGKLGRFAKDFLTDLGIL